MIVLVKFTNGVEIIGTFVDQSSKLITIENPIQINYKNLESYVPSILLTRFMQFAKHRQHEFDKKNVLNVTEPNEHMERYYEIALNHFETEVDGVVEKELARVIASETEEDQADVYTAILERLSTTKILN